MTLKMTSPMAVHNKVSNKKHNSIKRRILINPPFLLYYFYMSIKEDKLGVFIIPTGIGASVGGYAGDAAAVAREFSKYAKLIVNPNVVNAGGFSGINDNMLYVEGYSLDNFMKGNIYLQPVNIPNKIGVVFDKDIPDDVLNVHINTMHAVKTVYGTNILGYEITSKSIGIDFSLNKSGISDGSVKNPEVILEASKKLLKKGCNTIGIVGMFDDPETLNEGYADGVGTDPVGGVEAILSHYISKYLKVPCAHSPAFRDYQIYPDIVSPKSAAEYITPTFLPCILLGLSGAPQLSENCGLSVKDVDFLIMPYDCLGNPAVLGAISKGIKVFSVKENSTALNITAETLGISDRITTVDSYQECLSIIKNL